MELRTNNLYVTGTVNTYPDGTQKLVRKRISYIGTINDEYHRVVQGDMLDKLASKFYSKNVEDASKLWWILADVNNIDNPLDISDLIGTTILIPNYYQVKLLLQ